MNYKRKKESKKEKVIIVDSFYNNINANLKDTNLGGEQKVLRFVKE